MAQKNNIIEKSIFLIGLLILLALIGYLAMEMSKKKKGPPALQVISQYDPALEKYGYRIEVENKGQESVESVNIEFELYQEGKVEAKSVVEMNHVPIKSKEIGWVLFSTTRRPGDSLVVKSISYIKP